MLGKAGRRKGGIGQRGGSGLSPEQQPELSAGGASWGRAIIPTPRDGADILFTRKEPFSIPYFPEKKKIVSKRKKNPLRLIKGKCSHLGKTKGFSLRAY